MLPQHLVGRIFDALDTKERARLTLVCRTWKDIAESNCSRLTLSFNSLKQLYYQRRWIDRLATKSSTSVRECHLYWEGGELSYLIIGICTMPCQQSPGCTSLKCTFIVYEHRVSAVTGSPLQEAAVLKKKIRCDCCWPVQMIASLVDL